MLLNNIFITPNSTRELECTVVLFDELIGAKVYYVSLDSQKKKLSKVMSHMNIGKAVT